MSKHTPGPWNYGEGYIDTHAVDDDGSRDYIILAEMHSTFGPDNYGVDQWMLPPEEYEANGRLIAAAPEMYELIQMLVRTWENDCQFIPCDTEAASELSNKLARLAAQAVPLLAKIEGGGE